MPALMMATQLWASYRAAGQPVSFAGMFLVQLCHWEVWAVAGPVVWSLAGRWPFDASRRRASAIRHLMAAPLVATVVIALYLAGYHALIRLPGLEPLFARMDRSVAVTTVFFFSVNFHIELLVYGAIVAAAHATRTTALLRAKETDALRLEAELVRAKLTTLRTQLQPHFLFNTLHTIGSLVMQGQSDRAVGLIAELGELLRDTLAHRETDLTPLGDELASLRRYLRIEEARFEDRLTIEWALDPAAGTALIPPFILQPIVENAFRHGIAHRTEHSLLRIETAMVDRTVRLSIYNDGPPVPEPLAPGYGIPNVRARLNTRQPAGLLAIANEMGGVRVTLTLPLWRADTEVSG